MKWLASSKLRLFLVCWVLYTLHFATNVVREHYPAFSLAEHGTFRLDEYAGFHADIFVHTDGHAYVGNQVATSVIAALPLWLFAPVLDELEDLRRDQLRRGTIQASAPYDTEYPLRAAFLQRVKAAGLDLRFGAAVALTAACVMAPLSALIVVLLFHVLLARGVARERAYWLALLFAFGTPLFYRTGVLSNNTMLSHATFAAFLLLWNLRDGVNPVSARARFGAGLLAGAGLAFDYAGAVSLMALYLYLVVARWRLAGFGRAFRESLVFVAGTLPTVGFLFWSQWVMYGHPLYPGQYWMPKVNYTEEGWRGFGMPAWDLFVDNLISLDWGLFPFAPLLVLAFVPALYRRRALLVPRAQRGFVWGFTLLLFLFCAANQYSRMQWNSGFRYFLPLVPFLFLAACDHLMRCPRWILFALTVPAVLHTWVLTMVRYTPPLKGMLGLESAVLGSWTRFLEGGVQLPWLTVLRQTTPDASSPIHWQIVPYALVGLTCLGWYVLEFLGREARLRLEGR
ncbi:MAG: hypothetical protein H6834_12040 [Planctomycetes bacterium]|nr:hypothetical protein [Planctomycetota bacterium]